jgi:hypothetical protein
MTGGGLVPLHDLCPVGLTPRQQNRGYRQDSLLGETHLFIYIEASRLCMDIYMHESSARFIFFINMLQTSIDLTGHKHGFKRLDYLN